MLNNKELRDKAWTLYNDMENCMCDMGETEYDADRIWNDPLELSDFMGDRIYWACNNLLTDDDKLEAMCLVDELYEIGHDAIKQTVNMFKKDRGWN